MSWSVVDSKWPGIRTAFAGFDPPRVAAMDAADIDCSGSPRDPQPRCETISTSTSTCFATAGLPPPSGPFTKSPALVDFG